jgi:hypothetical protein
MNVDLSIIPECFVDTNLIETISPAQKGYNHQKGCGNVARTMQNKFKDSFAVGIIDRDKKEIKYLNEFKLKVNRGDLFLFQHPERHHYIIQISPAVEKFILESANQTNINLEDFGLPHKIDDLKKITKKQTSKKSSQFSKLFAELKNKNATQIVTLSKWISYLKENTYHSNINEIINIHS